MYHGRFSARPAPEVVPIRVPAGSRRAAALGDDDAATPEAGAGPPGWVRWYCHVRKGGCWLPLAETEQAHDETGHEVRMLAPYLPMALYTLLTGHCVDPERERLAHRRDICHLRRCCNPAHRKLVPLSYDASEWARGAGNGRAKLTAAQVRAVRAAQHADEPSASVARRFGLNKRHVQNIWNRTRWGWLPDEPTPEERALEAAEACLAAERQEWERRQQQREVSA